METDDDRKALARAGDVALARTAASPWSGEEHRMKLDAAQEAGLRRSDVELESFTEGFSDGIVVDDPDDRAVVARGRTVLAKAQLTKVLLPAMTFLGIARDEYKVRLHDGEFELRLSKLAVERAAATQGAPTDALKTFLSFGLLGFAVYSMVAPWAGGILWGIGLLLGGWQLRKGLTSGRAMLAGKLAIALAMIAQEEGLVLPPTGDRPAPLPPADDQPDDASEDPSSDGSSA